MAVFVVDIRVRFSHVDQAGLIFYPRYFEMFNEVIEEWFDRGLDCSFRQLHGELRCGVPAVRVEAEFLQPCRLGDLLRFTLGVREIGGSAVTISVGATCGDEKRLEGILVFVYVSLADMRSRPIPTELRAAMSGYLRDESERATGTSYRRSPWCNFTPPRRYIFSPPLTGQVGWDPSTETFASDDFVDQARQALANTIAVLAEADATPAHLARMTWYVVDKAEYLTRRQELGRIYVELIGHNYPAMTLIEVAGLLEACAKVEIEATAVVPADPT